MISAFHFQFFLSLTKVPANLPSSTVEKEEADVSCCKKLSRKDQHKMKQFYHLFFAYFLEVEKKTKNVTLAGKTTLAKKIH